MGAQPKFFPTELRRRFTEMIAVLVEECEPHGPLMFEVRVFGGFDDRPSTIIAEHRVTIRAKEPTP